MRLEPADLHLRFIPLADALAHEAEDPARTQDVAEHIQQDGYQRNPIVVAEHEQKYIVLDGATRIAALRHLGLRDVLAQIVDYADPAVQLSEWHHVLVGIPANRLLAELADIEGVTLHPVEASVARRELALRQIVGCVVMSNGQHYAVIGEGHPALAEQAAMLRKLAGVYRGKVEVHTAADVDLPALHADYADLAAVVMFPRFTPAEVAAIALGPAKLPVNITRHVIGLRALGLNVGLDLLGADKPLDEKNQWLDELIHARLRGNHVRAYQEPVIIFDE